MALPEPDSPVHRSILALLGRRVMPTRADTDSMFPTIHPGERILVDFAAERPRFGQLWVFRSGGEQVVHRYLGRVPWRGGWCLRFRGDNRPHFDPPAREQDLRGRVVGLERRGRWRSLCGRGAGLYGAAVAVHDHAFGLAGGAVERVARAGGARPGDSPLLRWLVRLDRALLRAADRGLFDLLHREMEPPRG